MWSTWVLVHWSCANMSILDSYIYLIKYFFDIFNLFLNQIFYEETSLSILSNSKCFRRWIQKILDFFIVNFKIRAVKFEWKLTVSSRYFFHFVKQMFKCSRHNTSLIFPIRVLNFRVRIICRVWSWNSMSLSRSCLSVCKYCCVKTLNTLINKRQHSILKETLSINILVPHKIKLKVSCFFIICIYFLCLYQYTFLINNIDNINMTSF